LLAFGASGDDFLLLRVATPFLPITPADPLPLDDPNTDFTAAADSGGYLVSRDHDLLLLRLWCQLSAALRDGKEMIDEP
jgi:hypothetical protein